MDGGTRARVEEEKALDSSRLRSSARLSFTSSSSAGSPRIARRKRRKRRQQQRRNSNVDDEDELVVVGGGGGGGGGDKVLDTVNETVDTIPPIKEEQHQPGEQVISSEESTTKQPRNRLSHTNESQRNVTRGSGSRAAASSLSSGNTLLNRRVASKRSSRRCNANARRNAMTMDLQRLITEVHARPAIWDQKNVNYHNRDVILKMWREIARACEVSSEYTPRSSLSSFLFPFPSSLFFPPLLFAPASLYASLAISQSLSLSLSLSSLTPSQSFSLSLSFFPYSLSISLSLFSPFDRIPSTFSFPSTVTFSTVSTCTSPSSTTTFLRLCIVYVMCPFHSSIKLSNNRANDSINLLCIRTCTRYSRVEINYNLSILNLFAGKRATF